MIPNCVKNNQRFKDIEEKQKIQYSKLEVVTSYIKADLNKVIKCGNVVRVDFRGEIIEDIPNATKIFQLPYIPATFFCEVCSLGAKYYASTLIWESINEYGEVAGNAALKGQFFHMHFTYISKD